MVLSLRNEAATLNLYIYCVILYVDAGFGSTTADTLPSVTMINLSMQKLPSTSSVSLKLLAAVSHSNSSELALSTLQLFSC